MVRLFQVLILFILIEMVIIFYVVFLLSLSFFIVTLILIFNLLGRFLFNLQIMYCHQKFQEE